MNGERVGTGHSIVSRVRWQLEYLLESVTYLQLLSVAFFLLWGGIYWQVLLPLERKLGEIQEHNSFIEASLRAPVSEPSDLLLPRSERFRVFLPSLDRRERQEGKLMSLANFHGLKVKRLDYSHESYPVAKIERQYLRLQTTGSYSAQRSFLHAVLSTLPNAAVDRISMSQGDTKDTLIVASMEISLFYRNAEGEGK